MGTVGGNEIERGHPSLETCVPLETTFGVSPCSSARNLGGLDLPGPTGSCTGEGEFQRDSVTALGAEFGIDVLASIFPADIRNILSISRSNRKSIGTSAAAGFGGDTGSSQGEGLKVETESANIVRALADCVLDSPG